jgi:putative nucleotidyltransferase with HDIG domain
MKPEHRDLLATLARQAAVAIENALSHDRSLNFFTHTSEIMVSFLEKMDPFYLGHSRGTAALADMLTRRAGIGDAERRSIHFGALLHDIGKLRLPPELLRSEKPLGEAERALLRQHPVFGLEMLKPITLLQDILPIVHAHHERWDGAGYPLGLKGDEIPLGARVVAIAEAFDAMTRRTPQGAERTRVDALLELERCAGTQFDPQLVTLFVAEHRRGGDPPKRASA